MKLDHDCIRDLMLKIEDATTLKTPFYSSEGLNGYSSDEVVYTIERLIEADYLNATEIKTIGSIPQYIVKSITWEGHKFLDNIRDHGVWTKTKSVLSKFSSTSIGIVGNVASQVVTALIKSQIGL